MRGSIFLLAATAAIGFGGVSRADDGAAAAAGAGPVGVMVAPFRLLSEQGTGGQGNWISAAIDEELCSQLLQNPSVRLIQPPAGTASSAAEVAAAGKRVGAKFVVEGSYQIENGQVRVTASVLNVADGSVAAPLAVTGSERDLFHMEDTLAEQMQKALPGQPAAMAQADVNAAAAAATAQATGAAPQAAAEAPAVSYPYEPTIVYESAAPAASYYYPQDYPYYYSEPFFGGVVVSNFGFNRFGFHRGFAGRGFIGSRFGGGFGRGGGRVGGLGGGFRGGAGFHGGRR